MRASADASQAASRCARAAPPRGLGIGMRQLYLVQDGWADKHQKAANIKARTLRTNARTKITRAAPPAREQ